MTRTTQCLGQRVDKWTIETFKDLCKQEELRPSQAIERFMELSNEKKSIVDLLRAAKQGLDHIRDANEAKARVLLDWLEKKTYWIYPETGKGVFIPGLLMDMLGTLQDENLRNKIEDTLIRTHEKKK